MSGQEAAGQGQYRPVHLQHVVPDEWITALANPPERDPHRSRRGGVDTRRLYDWLGEQIEISRAEAHNALDSLHGPDEFEGMTDAYQKVRRQMRRFDKSLPKTSADRI